MKFKKVWTFPLVRRGSKVYDSNDTQVFDFCGYWNKEGEWKIDEESKDKLVSVLNGTEPVENKQILTHKHGEVFMERKGKVKKLLVMRGWTYMTAEVCLNMRDDEAVDMQNEFCEFIVDSVK